MAFSLVISRQHRFRIAGKQELDPCGSVFACDTVWLDPAKGKKWDSKNTNNLATSWLAPP
jgi:hypothetical protein